jgi:hypothetical protein
MNWTDTKLRLQFAALFLTVLCPGLLIYQASQTRRQLASTGWPSVPGEVQGIIAKTWSDRDNHIKYYGRVIYRYAVNGKEYTSDLTDLGPGSKRASREDALADVSRFQPGMAVTVYYDPDDPSVGIIEKGIPTMHLVLLIGLIVGTVVGVVVSFFTVRGWIRSRRQKNADGQLPPSERIEGASPPQDTHAPADAQAAELGERIEVFRPMMGNVIAGFILSGLVLVGSAAAIFFPLRAAYLANWNLPFDVKTGWSWLAVGLCEVLGIGLLIGGLALLVYSRGLLSHCVEIYANGFRYCSGRSAECVLWTHVSHVRELILYERHPILKGPAKFLLPKVASTSYLVHTISGKEYGFDGNSIRSIKRFGNLLREQSQRLSLPWETVEEHA